ncbi:hypothetical protein GCM10023091_27920 [Ravibacter arvi]|uniref:Outer membrane protein TolC n=1 Tax=Ravibacter arvi TaxID=2051041 RepID=A0ABP8M2N8_9BACT
MKKTWISGLLMGMAVAATQPLYAQEAPTLDELINSAIENSHVLADKKLDLDATALDKKRLQEAYLPHVDLSGKYSFMASAINIKAPANVVPELGIKLPPLDNSFTNRANLVAGGLNADMLLYSGGKVPYLKKAVDAKINAQTALLETDKQQIISDVSAAYDQMALLAQVKVVLNESRNRLEANAETADKALKYGLMTPYEHQKIDVAQAQLDAKIQQYEGRRKLLVDLLHYYTGIEPERLARIEPALVNAQRASDDASVENRPEVAALNAGINAYQFQIKAAQSWWKPKVQLKTSLGYLNAFDMHLKATEPFPTGNTMSLTTNKLELLPNFSVGVGFKWDIFDGKKGKRDVQAANIDLQRAQNHKKETLEKLELNLAKQNTEYQNAVAEINVREKQKTAAQNALNQATKEFKTGLLKASDLIGAETDYQSATLDYLQAVFNQRRTVVELLKATGSLTPQSVL